jgi:hypothetical protein
MFRGLTILGTRCSVPERDGANSSLTRQEEEALWQVFFTAAPARRGESILRANLTSRIIVPWRGPGNPLSAAC